VASETDNTGTEASATPEKNPEKRVIKVLVWDLDHTLWNGTLIEGDKVEPKPGVVELLETLDQRGLLHSIASKNDHEDGMARLKELGLDHYFLYPQISWNAKSAGIEQIAKDINIGLDAVAFIDDQPFEREEVSHVLPDVMTLDATELDSIAGRPEFMPRFITDESAIRRKMYQADVARNQAEDGFVGPQEDFLAGLQMRFTIQPAREEDLKRAEELTVRTNQLNSTGYTYSYDELDAFRKSDDHLLLVADLVDKYGTYGKIGLALIEKGNEVWRLRLLLMSCRVMARGVGSIMMSNILNRAKEAGARFLAELRVTGRNRLMMVTYKFANFKELERQDDLILFEHPLENIQPYPDYVDLKILD
jgi:FkbH-like protein